MLTRMTLLVVVLTACGGGVDARVSTTGQELCTIENQDEGRCASPWDVAALLTEQYADERFPGVPRSDGGCVERLVPGRGWVMNCYQYIESAPGSCQLLVSCTHGEDDGIDHCITTCGGTVLD